MIAYAWRSVPLGSLMVAGGLLVVLMLVVARWPYTMWPLQGCAVGLLAGAAAWCFDEPAAAVADTAPRSLLWRTVARSAGLVVLLLWWGLAVRLAGADLFGHALDVAWQGVVAVLATTAYVTWRRSRGVATPGRATAAAVAPAVAFVALARLYADRVPVFPYTAAGDWALSRALWTAIALASVTALAVVLAERRSTGPAATEAPTTVDPRRIST